MHQKKLFLTFYSMFPFFFLFFLNILLIAIAISKQHKNMASSRKSMIRQIKTAITSIILSIIFMFSTMPTAGWEINIWFQVLFNLKFLFGLLKFQVIQGETYPVLLGSSTGQLTIALSNSLLFTYYANGFTILYLTNSQFKKQTKITLGLGTFDTYW